MKIQLKISLLIIFLTFCLPAKSTSIDRYDNLLNKLDNLQAKKTLVLTFQHDELPVLDGTWILKKKSIKRIEAPLRQPMTHSLCNSRLPFKEDQIEKEIILSSRGQDFFVFRSIYPATVDTYLNLTKTKTAQYQNSSLKGVVIPEEITYAYTLKLINHLENPAYVRQLFYRGKIITKSISRDRISGEGYEIEYTPECQGFVRNEIVFEMIKQNSNEQLGI
ncbi:MAG: hypothetical protein HYY52_00100 [Candidatus Melainabacteria bacterium]|nr:hypothetical protein [Candidatus Melainabacteria bacterium]